MILCHRVVGSMKQNILHNNSEAAFHSLAVMLLFSSQLESGFQHYRIICCFSLPPPVLWVFFLFFFSKVFASQWTLPVSSQMKKRSNHWCLSSLLPFFFEIRSAGAFFFIFCTPSKAHRYTDRQTDMQKESISPRVLATFKGWKSSQTSNPRNGVLLFHLLFLLRWPLEVLRTLSHILIVKVFRERERESSNNGSSVISKEEELKKK